MTAALAAMGALGPLSTDMYLPSLPEIGRHLQASQAHVQLTLSSFFVGFAMGQVAYGPLADKHGRKPILALGFAIFIAACLACALAPTIGTLIAGRFAQGAGAAGPVILARAIVRDLYEGARAGREMSRIGSMTGLMPAVAPAIGGVLQVAFGWHASFIASAAGGALIFAALALLLPETIRERRPEGLSPASILASFRVVAASAHFRFYAVMAALVYAGIFAFISASSFVLQGHYGLGEVAYGFTFGTVAAGFVSGNLIGTRLNKRFGQDRAIFAGACCVAVGGIVQAALATAYPYSVVALMAPMLVYTCGLGLVMPQAMASSMAPFPERAGAAASLAGVIQVGAGAIVGIALSLVVPDHPLALPLTTAALGAATLALYGARWARRR